jgi:hypothetical protein
VLDPREEVSSGCALLEAPSPQEAPMDPALRLQPGQQTLTPAQQAEAKRFAEAYLQAQLSTEPVDEPAAEGLLRHVYQIAGLAPPTRIHWLDGPLEWVAVKPPGILWDSLGDQALDSMGEHWWASVGASLEASVLACMQASVRVSVWEHVWEHVWERMEDSVVGSVEESVWERMEASVYASVRAYREADRLALAHFFDVYLAPNDLHALACFNQLVSGYWLRKEAAVLVRRPIVLCLDAEGRLHSETGQCVEYPDGWGFYAWHGVRVPERVILAPERLSRQDWSKAQNAEVRRVMQERMGQRFVPELAGVVLDRSPRGTLYEVRLPEDDPEGVARYVQVQDASTPRSYFLRVPPTIQTAAEALAWSFGLSVQEFGPAHET